VLLLLLALLQQLLTVSFA